MPFKIQTVDPSERFTLAIWLPFSSENTSVSSSIVTIGWVVFLQVGLLLYERLRYGTTLSPQKWAAIVLILALQAYLVLVPNESSAADVAAKPAGEQAVGERTTGGERD